MNYTREQLDAILDKYAPLGWQMSFHVNGDIGLDIVLDVSQAVYFKPTLDVTKDATIAYDKAHPAN